MKNIKVENRPDNEEISIYEQKVIDYYRYYAMAHDLLFGLPLIIVCCILPFLINWTREGSIHNLAFGIVSIIIFLLYVTQSSYLAIKVAESMAGISKEEKETREMQVENAMALDCISGFEKCFSVKEINYIFDKKNSQLKIVLTTEDKEAWNNKTVQHSLRAEKWIEDYYEHSIIYNFADNSLVVPAELCEL